MITLKRDQFTQNMVPPLPGAGIWRFMHRISHIQQWQILQLVFNKLQHSVKDYKVVTIGTGIIVPEDLQFGKC